MIQSPEIAHQDGFARAIVALLEAHEIRYAIGGSVAAMEYGEPRFTIDIDVMIQADVAALSALLQGVDDLGL